ncbi:unnamed protein product [Blepharisma stoltei]|uniref:Aldos-2-ulose dehydratase/isomerase (AUDH) Cupin domain-containing protein n=1 Tax=Blepharisma stoltei TaxID=1481888 RepID=A0AAU9K1P9_9CILI|nr:unnamed protein product [Blepharisma stoltei]
MAELGFHGHSIIVRFTEQPVCESTTWNIGGYIMKFVKLQSYAEYCVQPTDYIKVIEGALIEPLRLSFPGPFTKASTVIGEDIIKAGAMTTLMIISKTNQAQVCIQSPNDLEVSGPYSELLKWKEVGELPGKRSFLGNPYYYIRGWDLRSHDNRHMGYIQGWLSGKAMNCGNCDYSEMGENTFRKIYLNIINGTGEGALVWYKDEEEHSLILMPGEEHGPIWEWDDDLTKVVYPMHRWQSGGEQALNADEERMDFNIGIELPPPRAA